MKIAFFLYNADAPMLLEDASTFWDGSNDCDVFVCAIWLDKVTGDLVIVDFCLPGFCEHPYNQVLGILPPVQ
jgi:hypothetical protein